MEDGRDHGRWRQVSTDHGRRRRQNIGDNNHNSSNNGGMSGSTRHSVIIDNVDKKLD